MPSFCAVVGCGSRGERDSKSFFRIPRVPVKGSKKDILKERREKWIEALQRDDLTDTKLKNARICNDHFINGYPATKYDSSNPDWIPSVKMGYIKENTFDPYLRSTFDQYNRRKLRSEASISTEVERRMHSVNNGRTRFFRKKLKKSVVPCYPSLSSTDKLEIAQYQGAADSSDKQMKSGKVNCPASMSVTVSDHPTEVIAPLEQEVSINLAQEKEVTFEDIWNSEVLGHRCLNYDRLRATLRSKQLSDRRTMSSHPDTTSEYSEKDVPLPVISGKQMSDGRTTISTPDTTCEYPEENVLFPVVDIKQEPQENLATSEKMERALAITDKLALFMSESSFFHEHMAFLQSIYDSWASGKIALKIQEEDNAKENKLGSNEIQDTGCKVKVSETVSQVTQTVNLVESSIIVPARDKICKCPEDVTTAIGLSNNKRHNAASLNNTRVSDSIQSHSCVPDSSTVMTSSVLPTNQVILYQPNSVSRDKNPFKDPVPSTIRTILGVIMEAQKNKPLQPQDCIKHLNQPCSVTSIPVIVKLNPS